MSVSPGSETARAGFTIDTRNGLLAYGVLSYGATVVAFVYFAAWISNVFLPVTIDSGPAPPTARALGFDAALLLGFCALHSLFARTRLKRVLRRHLDPRLERATYCLVFSALLIALCLSWRPSPELVWAVRDPLGASLLHGAFAFAWAIHLLGIALIHHNEFFGLRQLGFAVRGEPYRPLPPVTRRRYLAGHVPLVVGLMMIPWATPDMSAGRLLFAVVSTVYCVLGAWWSDRDAVV